MSARSAPLPVAMLAAALFCAAAVANGLPLHLRTGELQLSPSRHLAGDARAGMLVATAEPNALGGFRAALGALGEDCVTVGGYIPPHSFIVHLVAEACADALSRVPGLASLTPLPGRLRLSPDLQQPPASAAAPVRAKASLSRRLPGASAAPAAVPAPPPPVRMLMLALARPAAALLPALAAALAPLCSHCSVTPWEANTALVSALAGQGCPPWDAPEAAGCALPPGTAAALAHQPAVVWVEAYTPAKARNVDGREALLTTDLFSWGGIAREFGACGGGGGCNLAADVPFSQLGSVVLGASGESTGVGAALRAGPCSAACASPACGQGFGTCGGGEETLVETAGLTGAGQLVQVCDGGLDTGLPFFFDKANPAVPRRRQVAPLATASPHRKVADYWAFADGIDGDGHGTHCAGSVGGNAMPAITAAGAAATAEDKSLLPLLSGLAPMARLAVADIVCDPVVGYPDFKCTTIQPIGRDCTPGFCAPPYVRLAGSRAFFCAKH